MIPAMAYSIDSSLESLGRPGETPEQGEECDYDPDIEKIEHGYLVMKKSAMYSRLMTRCLSSVLGGKRRINGP